MTNEENGLTEGVAQQLWYFMMAVHDGRFDDAAVHDRLARAQFFEGIAKQLSDMSSAVRLAAMRAMKKPKWAPESDGTDPLKTYETVCAICACKFAIETYDAGVCPSCGQKYQYDEGHSIVLTPEQLVLLRKDYDDRQRNRPA